MKPKAYWHIHHETLVELNTEPIKTRIAYIMREKPKSEIAVRLRLLRPVKGALPAKFAKFVKACEAHVKASGVLLRASEAHVKAGGVLYRAREAHVKAGRVLLRAREAHVKAGRVLDRAREAYVKAGRVLDRAREVYKPQLEALHKRECRGCPWNGSTIFPKESA